MKHNIFAVYDSKAEAYTTPFFDHAEGRAIRTFADCCNDPGHQFGKHPADYTLFQIGEYDDSLGTIDSTLVRSIQNGLQLLEAK